MVDDKSFDKIDSLCDGIFMTDNETHDIFIG